LTRPSILTILMEDENYGKIQGCKEGHEKESNQNGKRKERSQETEEIRQRIKNRFKEQGARFKEKARLIQSFV